MIAISTAFKRALIGVEIGGKQYFEELDANCKHSENLLPSLDNILRKSNAGLKDNDCFAVVIGPGSFTGLRISLALVKGFMAANGQKNVVAITTNELMAYSYLQTFEQKEHFLTVIDALSGLYYICEFDEKGQKVGEEKVVTAQEIEKLSLKKIGLSEENAPVDEKITPTSKQLLNLALNMQKSKKFVDISKLSPLYLRKSQAEDNLAKKN